MNYWLDLFTVKTLEEFQKAGAKVSGFREWRFHTCEQIQPGDKLLCYLTGISRWVGVLRVTKPVYRSEDRIWDMEVFPIRLGVEPEILLPPEHGVQHQTPQAPLHSSTPSVGASESLYRLLEKLVENEAVSEKARQRGDPP